MDLEYLLRVPTGIGTIDVGFGNNGRTLFPGLEVTEEDRQTFKLLGLDPNRPTLIKIEKENLDVLAAIGISPDSPQVQFFGPNPDELRFYDPPQGLADLVADAYSSVASLPSLEPYKSIQQELDNELKSIGEHTRNRRYVIYGAIVAAIASLIAGYSISPIIGHITSSAALILLLGTGIYYKRVYNRAKDSYDQLDNKRKVYDDKLKQETEAIHNAQNKLNTLRETLLATGWFPAGYGR